MSIDISQLYHDKIRGHRVTTDSRSIRPGDIFIALKGEHFNGNQYFMCVFKIYRDVRLVGAPNSAIGKFGGDTDNWMWPRHTGDFSVLRIYAGPDNEPAAVSPSNVPYKPARSFKISARGIKEGDFTMVFGYPGTTKEYLTSFAIDQVAEVENPHKVKIRTAKLNVINAAMESDELLRIKYSAKAASVANAWKKWQGEIKGLERFRTAEHKRELEQRFDAWANASGKKQYVGLTARYKELYDARRDYILASAYASEAGLGGAEVLGLIASLDKAFETYGETEDKEAFKNRLKEFARAFYKDYDAETDSRILKEMLALYNNGGLAEEWIPEEVRAAGDDLTGKLFHKSIFTSQERLEAFIDNLSPKAIAKARKEPLYRMMTGIQTMAKEKIMPRLSEIERELTMLNRTWVAGLMEMQPDKVFYPDANSTLRLTYGKVASYSPADGVINQYFTTLEGVMQKEDPQNYEFVVPEKLKQLYRTKDYGRYALPDSIMPVCFIVDTDNTGGNSGSPVFNAHGELIGTAFDRNYEGLTGDIAFRPSSQRAICVDIRYILFTIEKYAGEVPSTLGELRTLAGVGRKTANVVYAVAFGGDAIAVDTHVFRVANRLGLARGKTPEKVEEGLCAVIPKERWSRAHHLLLFHGRRVCHSQRPDCAHCAVAQFCDFHNGKSSEKA